MGQVRKLHTRERDRDHEGERLVEQAALLVSAIATLARLEVLAPDPAPLLARAGVADNEEWPDVFGLACAYLGRIGASAPLG